MKKPTEPKSLLELLTGMQRAREPGVLDPNQFRQTRMALILRLSIANGRDCASPACRRAAMCQRLPLNCLLRHHADAYDWDAVWIGAAPHRVPGRLADSMHGGDADRPPEAMEPLPATGESGRATPDLPRARQL